MGKKEALNLTLKEVMLCIAIGAILLFMAGFNYWVRQA